MNRDDLYIGFNEVDDDILERSEEATQRKRSFTWLKWTSLAACFCVLICIAVPTLMHRGGSGHQDYYGGSPAESALLYFQGALYECCDIPEVLDKLGLPAEISADLAGPHVAYIEMGGPVDYQETASQTDTELYQYAPAPCRSVYILRSGGKYMAVVFSRIYLPDNPGAYTELSEVYRVYNIDNADDIASVAHVDWSHEKITGAEITDANAIDGFYTLTTDIESFISMDNDAFQDRVFGDIPEENAQEAYNAFADDLKVLRIETEEGLRFFVNIYPSYGYVYCSKSMAYYQITPELAQWLSVQFGF